MSLADALSSPPPVRKGPACQVAVQVDALDPRDAAALLAAVNGNAWQATVLEKTLAEQGVRLPIDVIRRHRTRRCACKDHRPELCA